jgi:hypothetical protein
VILQNANVLEQSIDFLVAEIGECALVGVVTTAVVSIISGEQLGCIESRTRRIY